MYNNSGRKLYLNRHLTRNIVIFALLGSVLFAVQVGLAAVMNIELVSMLIMAYTVVYRKRALVPIYIFVFLEGLMWGFSAWWLMYLYVWLFIWGGTMLATRRSRGSTPTWVYMTIGALFGISFGTLCSPVQALTFGFNISGVKAWIIGGLGADLMHAVGNCAAAPIAPVVAKLLFVLEKQK